MSTPFAGLLNRGFLFALVFINLFSVHGKFTAVSVATLTCKCLHTRVKPKKWALYYLLNNGSRHENFVTADLQSNHLRKLSIFCNALVKTEKPKTDHLRRSFLTLEKPLAELQELFSQFGGLRKCVVMMQ